MTQTIPIPDEYKDKLDKYLFLLSRTCANVEFFIMKHKEEPTSLNDSLFKRLFTDAESAAIDYHKMQSFVKDNLLGKDSCRAIKMGTGRGNTYNDRHDALVVLN